MDIGRRYEAGNEVILEPVGDNGPSEIETCLPRQDRTAGDDKGIRHKAIDRSPRRSGSIVPLPSEVTVWRLQQMALEDDTGQLGAVQMQRLQKDDQRNCRTGSNWINLGFSNFSLEASSFAQPHPNPPPPLLLSVMVMVFLLLEYSMTSPPPGICTCCSLELELPHTSPTRLL